MRCKAIAAEIGISHIAYVRFASDKECDACLPTAIATYSRAWQTHYFVSGYVRVDPVIAHGRKALLPFDWEDARRATIRPYWRSLPMRRTTASGGMACRRRSGTAAEVRALVSFSSDHEKPEWNRYKLRNMVSLQKLAFLIDSAANRNSRPSPGTDQPVAARGRVPDLGGKRKNGQGNRRRPGYRVQQREGPPRRRPSQVALHEPDPCDRRRHCDRRNFRRRRCNSRRLGRRSASTALG